MPGKGGSEGWSTSKRYGKDGPNLDQLAECDILVKEVAHWLAIENCTKSEVKNRLRDLLDLDPPPHHVILERIISAARRYLREQSERDSKEWIQEAIATYRDIIADKSLSATARMNAQVELTRLMGVGGQFKSAGGEGETADEKAHRIRDVLGEMLGTVPEESKAEETD